MKSYPLLRKWPASLLLALGLLGVTLAVNPLRAGNATWTATSSGNWNVDGNWLPASAPGATSGVINTDTATFNGTATLTTTVDTNRNLKGIVFDGNVGKYTLSSGSFILTNGGSIALTSAVSSSGNTEAVNSNIALAGSASFVNNATTTDLLAVGGNVTGVASGTSTLTLDGTNSGLNTLSGILANGASGTLVLVKTGTGSWSLTNADTYSGATTVKNGNLTFSGGGSAASSAITVGQAGSNVSTSITFTAPAVSGSKTYSSSLTFNGSFFNTTSSSADANFNVKGSSAGNVIDNFGALTMQSGEVRGLVPSNVANGNSRIVFTGVTRNAGTQLNFGNGILPGTAALASPVANTANVVFTSAPTLTGSGSAGTTTVGVLPWAFVGGGLATYDSTFGLRALDTTAEEAVLSTSLTSSTNAKMTGVLTLASATSVNAVALASSNVLTLGSGSASDTTALNVTSGAVSVSASVTFGKVVGNGVLNFGSVEGNIAVAGSRTMTMNSSIHGTGGLTIGLDETSTASPAAVVLENANTYTGVTTFEGNNSAQLVYLANTNALQNTTLDYNNYGASFAFGTSAGTGGLTAYTFGGLKGAQNITLANINTSVQAVALTVGGDTDSTTYSGVLSDGTTAGGSLVKTGSGALTLTGANTYTGGTTISGGKLYANNTSGSGTGTGAVTVQTGGALAGNGTIASTSGGITVQNGGTLASGATQTTAAYSNGGTGSVSGPGLTINNAAALSGALLVNGGGTLSFALGSTVNNAGSGALNFANPNTNSTYLNLTSMTVDQIFANTTAASPDTINLVDLTAGAPAGTVTLTLRYQNPYLLIQTALGTNSDFMNLWTTGGEGQNGYVLGVSDGTLTGFTPFTIAMQDINGTNLITSTNYEGLRLYLNNGDLEVVPEPGTWALMVGGLALLVVCQRRRNQDL